jgi:hypothetical protein
MGGCRIRKLAEGYIDEQCCIICTEFACAFMYCVLNVTALVYLFGSGVGWGWGSARNMSRLHSTRSS